MGGATGGGGGSTFFFGGEFKVATPEVKIEGARWRPVSQVRHVLSISIPKCIHWVSNGSGP